MGVSLLPRNQEYFKRLQQYVTEAIGVDTVAAADMLAEIHADLLQAQKDGLDAADYFGDDPKAIGDQLIKNLPHRSRKTWVLMAIGAWGLSFFFITWRMVDEHGRLVPIGTVAGLAVLLPVTVLALTEWHRRGSFTRKKLRSADWVMVIVVQLVIQPLSDVLPKFGNVWLAKPFIAFVGFALALILIVCDMWLGMHSWFFAGIVAIFVTMFMLPAVDALGDLPGWWGRLNIPLLFIGSVLLMRIGEVLWPSQWQADGKHRK